ncbi:pyridoxal phosphate-dependent decarboxylase family protein [Arsenicibacter rosenii]|uniref:Pyridoxal-dependent decarboxylase n=1 Tax=Arsenicibacter rosenii TaxID=1750698 RepID=A0A1S2VIS6_9BACT|nr:pyridoxal-dependent decarboxylase [Arsenicibacter rosenii]OIN58145.1 pyridoxal-dependent decarboxylase [Arsenicibacter rosenii]
MELLTNAYSAENFRRQAHDLVDQLAGYLQSAQDQTLSTVIPYQSPDENYRYWQADFAEGSGDLNAFFNEVISRSTHLHHPRYMGHQVAPPLPVAALAGLLSGLLNNGMAVYEMGLVSNPLERIVSELLAQRIGFDPQTSSGLLTSGGTLANLTALLAARAVHAPTVWQAGSSEKLAIMVSEEAHYCVDRAARIMGLGTGGIIKIPVNDRFQMRTELLGDYFRQAQADGLRVFAVVASACSTSTGAYDTIPPIADFCEKNGLWLHVDGAHGGAVVFSEQYRHLVTGINRADSVVVDWHKMLMVPALATALVFRRNKDAFQTFHQQAQYLWADQQSTDWFNSGKRTFECTKLMMSVKIYAILKTYGEKILAENIERLHSLAQYFAGAVASAPDFTLALWPESNIVCFRYQPENDMAAVNERNSLIRQRLLAEGRFYIVQTTLNGAVYLRVSIMNPLTTTHDLDALLTEIRGMV